MSEQTILLRPKGQKIITQDHEFFKGYTFGYRYYVTTCSHLPLLDIGIYELIVGTIISVRHSGRRNAGFIVGWIAALLDHTQEETGHTGPLVAMQEEEIPTC